MGLTRECNCIPPPRHVEYILFSNDSLWISIYNDSLQFPEIFNFWICFLWLNLAGICLRDSVLLRVKGVLLNNINGLLNFATTQPGSAITLNYPPLDEVIGIVKNVNYLITFVEKYNSLSPELVP